MSRYIDADALIDNFAELTVDLWLDSVEEAEIVSLIGNAPTIEPKRGEWIDFKNGWKCNVCEKWNSEKSNFCPNCGARMRPKLQGKHFDSIIIDECTWKGADDE